MYNSWTLLKTRHNYWQQTKESFVTAPIIPAHAPLVYPSVTPIYSLIHPIVSVWPSNCVMMCPPPSPTPLLPRNCARIIPNVRHWTCLGRYTNTASHYHNHRYGLLHPLGKPYPTVKLSSLLWNSPCTIKGDPSKTHMFICIRKLLLGPYRFLAIDVMQYFRSVCWWCCRHECKVHFYHPTPLLCIACCDTRHISGQTLSNAKLSPLYYGIHHARLKGTPRKLLRVHILFSEIIARSFGNYTIWALSVVKHWRHPWSNLTQR